MPNIFQKKLYIFPKHLNNAIVLVENLSYKFNH